MFKNDEALKMINSIVIFGVTHKTLSLPSKYNGCRLYSFHGTAIFL